jgi:hypothetical protein
MKINNIMETIGVAGYPAQISTITVDMWNRVESALNQSFQGAFDLMEWFKAENVHRSRPGVPIESEKDFLKHLKRQAEDFITQLESYEEDYKARMLYTPIPPISLDRIPEDILPNVMSYLSPIVRLENLRKKYTNDFLTKALTTKKIHQLKSIHYQYVETICNTCRDIWGRYGGDIGIVERSLMDISDYVEDHPYKSARVNSIIHLYIVIENHLMISLIKQYVYDKHCELVIKMLHLLVIICKNPRKVSHRTPRCHDARIMTKVPYAV